VNRRLVLHGRDVPERFEQPSIVEPVNPGQRRNLDLIRVAPWSAGVSQLGLVEPDHRLSERAIARVGRRARTSIAGLSMWADAVSDFPGNLRLGDSAVASKCRPDALQQP
jgi:hypothetical protein